MSYNLQNWDRMVTETLHPSGIERFTDLSEFRNTILEQSSEENEKVRFRIIKDILERTKIKDKEQYIKVTQVMLVELLDKLYSYKQVNELREEVLDLYDIISRQMQDILGFIRNTFNNYFDRNGKVPFEYLDKSLNEIKKKIKLISEKTQSSSMPHCELLDLFKNNLSAFCGGQKRNITYRELMYQKDLLNHLLREDVFLSESLLKEVLFYYNYNDEGYLEYLYRELDQIIRPLNNSKKKIAALRFEQKIFNQLHTRPDCYLIYGMPFLKEQLNHWIEEEIRFLEAEENSLVVRGDQDQGAVEEIFVHVPFRGTEIYLLHKAFIDSGGTSGETYKSLFEKTGSHLINNNQRGFSSESLQKNSDKVNYEVKDNVKRFLQKMIRNIESY